MKQIRLMPIAQSDKKIYCKQEAESTCGNGFSVINSKIAFCTIFIVNCSKGKMCIEIKIEFELKVPQSNKKRGVEASKKCVLGIL